MSDADDERAERDESDAIAMIAEDIADTSSDEHPEATELPLPEYEP